MAELSGGRERARYRRIVWFAARFMVVAWWFELVLPRFGLSALSDRGRTERLRRFARRFHGLALELGGLMIKVGQFLSTRLDVLPPEITAELDGLQDEVPAVPIQGIRAVAEPELGMRLDEAFVSFDPVPVAAASLGQAHRARLSESLAADAGFADVVVKVQRPGIETIVRVDLAALRRIAGWLSRVRFVSSRVDAPALVEEFATTSLQEIDYLHEAANAERFAEDFAGDDRVATPRVAWERTRGRVLALEDVSAIKITDVDALRAAGIDPDEVADTLARVTFEQLFGHGFFHADPHPGNIFVTPTGDGWTLTFVDFGMMGEIPEALRAGLRDVIIAVVGRDARGMVAGIQRVGVLLPSADTAGLEQAMAQLFDRFGGMGVSELAAVDRREMADFADEFGDTLRGLPVQLPENFLLIVRAISLVSGVCSALNPTFNMWQAVEPYAASLVRSQGSRRVQDLGRQLVSTAGMVAALPGRIDRLLADAEHGRLSVASPGTERRLQAVERAVGRVVSAVLFAGLLIAGALLRPDGLGTGLMALSVLPLLHVMLSGRRRR
ncbi:AarF/UbiB family protein [Cellulomonas sp. NPDC089187]|uniref:ABC1 kinase family protein n=1 Tax=Cellulomonas sp. NPDC089187 TaxID=3154970 RepID=UPI00343EAA5D